MVHSLSWHRSGVRTSLPRSCLSFRTFFRVFVELLSRKTNLNINDLPQMVTFHGKVLYLHSATLRSGNHYICFQAWKCLILNYYYQDRETLDTHYLTLVQEDFH